MTNYIQISSDRFNVIRERYELFTQTFNDLSREPVKVFDPLPPKQLEELELIREVSRDLQSKKEEEIRRVAQAREEEKLAAEEKKKEAKEAVEEETKQEE